jgi:hypothetical protein
MAKTKTTRRGGAAKRSRKSPTAKGGRGAKRARSGGRRAAPRAGRSSRKTTAKRAKSPARATSRKTARASAKKKAAASKRSTRQSTAKTTRSTSPRATATGPVSPTPRPRRPPTLDRERRRATEPEMVPSPPSSLNLDRSASAARTGRAELAEKLQKHTSTGPALTGGDIDADWESAEAVGDEAPGGDNPTPDQDVVDEIGKALGVEYDDDEELQGGEEILRRDRNRWELDPSSRDDFDDE